MIERKPYSYTTDLAVPALDLGDTFTVMDAHCSLCAKGARWISRNDTAQAFKIVPLQSDEGKALMLHYGLDPEDPTSWLYIENGKAYTSIDAFIRVGHKLGGGWKALSVLRIVPPFLQSAVYGIVARNRYKVFGRTDLCALPDPEVQERLAR